MAQLERLADALWLAEGEIVSIERAVARAAYIGPAAWSVLWPPRRGRKQ
jgi:hypothetical protein